MCGKCGPKLGVGITLLIIGIIAIVVGAVLPRLLLDTIITTVRDDTTAVDDGNLVISGEDPEKAATYYEYYMYNITNPEAVVRSNAFPVLQEVGPYKYKEICRKYRQATSTVDEFQYKELCYKVLVTGNENDIITSVNPQYYGAAMLAGGSETNLKLNAIGGILKTVFASVVAALFAGNKATFATYWSTGLPQPAFTLGGTVGLREVLQAGTPSVRLDCIPEWYRFWQSTSPVEMAYKAACSGCPTNTTFSDAAAQLIIDGPRGITTEFTDATLGKIYGSAYLAAIGLQIGTLLAAGNTAGVANIVSAVGPVYGITTATEFLMLATFMRYLSVQYFAASFAAQGSTNYGDESRNHFLYSRTVAATLHAGGNHEFLGRLGVASSSSYFPPDCPADYKSVLAATGKYTYSAACETEFLNTPGTYVYGVRTGRSNIAQRDDYTLWNSVTVLPQKTATTPATVRAYWCGGEVPVTGKRGPRVLSAEVDYKDFSLTTPLDNPSTTITLWVSEIIRSAKLVQTGKSDINGIPTHTFEPDPSFFEPDPVYSMPFRGSSSHTCPKGVPILLTPPHFYGTPFESATTNTADPLAAGYQTVVPADRPTGSRQKDGVFIHVDRLTGMGIDGNLRLQVNFVIPAGTTGITPPATATYNKLILPIMWINKYGQLSSSQTDELKRAHKAIDAAYPVFLALIISGPVLAALGLVLIILACKGGSSVAPDIIALVDTKPTATVPTQQHPSAGGSAQGQAQAQAQGQAQASVAVGPTGVVVGASTSASAGATAGGTTGATTSTGGAVAPMV